MSPPRAPAPAASELFAGDLLDGQVALVTGGGTGLGRAAAVELAACGADVVLAGRRREVLDEAAAAIGPRASVAPGDIRDPAQAEQIVEAALGRSGRVDVLVNNAGGQYFAPAEAIATKGWRAVGALNVGAGARMAELVVQRAMRPAGRGGTVVNVTLSPHHGLPGMAHSSSVRAAAEALSRRWAHAWAADGIAVVAVAAGHFDTEALSKYPRAVRESVARTVPRQRLGRPQEHAWLIALLASPLGRAFSGSVVTLDGGRDNWFGPWPPPGLAGEAGEVPTEERGVGRG